ncbi:hypothetical protein PR202_ga25197 [Eleusine coracana subsp. coracana]|uniref:Uncharacterized protein n=1 Tax=Eleusine coracana subsp. coracana TaxID=191504 RepID=A0AAV5DAR4_ELECO|nr:hypothetical protein PR202_ga25197 [Eleusine coracana subsp. coracana]
MLLSTLIVRQLLQPSRFLREIPVHLLEVQGEESLGKIPHELSGDIAFDAPEGDTSFEKPNAEQTEALPYPELPHGCLANDFLKRFDIDDRSVVSHIFHHWAKKVAFQNPKRLLDKDVLRNLKSFLNGDEAVGYAQYDHFQKQRIENSMDSSEPTVKQAPATGQQQRVFVSRLLFLGPAH